MQINLDLRKQSKSGLSLIGYLFLQVLYNKSNININEFTSFEIAILHDFEENNYIRIIEDAIIIDAKTKKLFETDVDVKGKEILEHFNGLKKKYKLSNRKTSYSAAGSNIRARLIENPDDSVEDVKKMLDYKFEEWINSDMRKYLRIETLFKKSKYQNYMDISGEHIEDNNLHEMV